MGAPVLAVLAQAIPLSAGWSHLFSAEVRQALYNTVILGLLVSLGSAVLAFVLAWAMTVTGIASNPVARTASLIPFMAPPYLMSMGWIMFMDPNGYLYHLAPWLGGLGSAFFSLWGLVMIMVLHLFPIALLAALEAMQKIRSRYEPAATVHGAGIGHRIWRIWLPLTAPLLIGATMLVFVKTIGEFGAPLVFGSMVQFPVLTTMIYLKMTNWPISFGAASQLSTLLLAIVFLVWLANDRYQRRSAVAETTRTSMAPPRQSRAVRWLAGTVIGAAALLSIVIPVGSLVITSLLRIEGYGAVWANLSLVHYATLLSPASGAGEALFTSLRLAAIAATIALLLSILVAVLARVGPSLVVRWTEWLGMLPNAIPDVLLAIGLILFWDAKWLPATPYDTRAMLVIGFVAVLFPFCFTYVRAAIFRLSPTTWEAALVHQSGWWYIARRIGLPLILSGMAAGWMMVFTVSVRDLVVPMLLSPPNTTLVSTYVYGQYLQGSMPDAMALAVVTLVITVFFLAILQWFNKSQQAAE
jgi:iron(III) transport system permease protein